MRLLLAAFLSLTSVPAAAADRGSADLVLAARDGDNSETLFDSYLEDGANVDSTDDNGVSVLMAAAENDQVKTVAKLLKLKADVDATDKLGDTALLRAAAKAAHVRPRVFELLVDAKAKADAVDADGRTALMLLPRGAAPEIAELLLKKGAPLDARDKSGKTALAWTLERKPFDAAYFKLLLQHGADVGLADAAGRTPLMRAAASGNAGAVESLLAKKADAAGALDAARSAREKLPQKDYERPAYDTIIRRLAALPAPSTDVGADARLSR